MSDFIIGVKAHYTDIHNALPLSNAIELHEDFLSMSGDGLAEQRRTLESLDGDSVSALSMHCPIYVKEGLFELGYPEYDGIVSDMLSLGDSLALKVGSVVYVFHAARVEAGRIFFTEDERRDAVVRLAETANSLAGEGRLITVENAHSLTVEFARSRVAANIFHRFEDFELFLERSENGVGITYDVCHHFISFGKDGYSPLRDFVGSYSEKIFNIHISDLRFSDPIGSEGTQIGKGDIDFERVFDSLSPIKCSNRVRSVAIIPEIKDGYLNDHAGSRLAIERLKVYNP
jgi:sugar phosphate isomerase/epimerase